MPDAPKNQDNNQKTNPLKGVDTAIKGAIDLVNPFTYLSPFMSPQENLSTRRKLIKSFKAKADAKRTPAEKFADWLTSKLGSVTFLVLNAVWFVTWFFINAGKVPGIEPFDPYPYGFLTMTVSLEAIFLAIIVLISQNREARVADLREEIELQINTLTETEITKLISMVAQLMEKQGIKIDDDPQIKKMLRPIDNAALERSIEKELENK
jgi:uncharacterized membrane protein